MSIIKSCGNCRWYNKSSGMCESLEINTKPFLFRCGGDEWRGKDFTAQVDYELAQEISTRLQHMLQVEGMLLEYKVTVGQVKFVISLVAEVGIPSKAVVFPDWSREFLYYEMRSHASDMDELSKTLAAACDFTQSNRVALLSRRLEALAEQIQA